MLILSALLSKQVQEVISLPSGLDVEFEDRVQVRISFGLSVGFHVIEETLNQLIGCHVLRHYGLSAHRGVVDIVGVLNQEVLECHVGQGRYVSTSFRAQVVAVNNLHQNQNVVFKCFRSLAIVNSVVSEELSQADESDSVVDFVSLVEGSYTLDDSVGFVVAS